MSCFIPVQIGFLSQKDLKNISKETQRISEGSQKYLKRTSKGSKKYLKGSQKKLKAISKESQKNLNINRNYVHKTGLTQ